jgi:hypothetical protein
MIFRVPIRNVFAGCLLLVVCITAAVVWLTALRPKSSIAGRHGLPEAVVAPFQPAAPLAPAIVDVVRSPAVIAPEDPAASLPQQPELVSTIAVESTAEPTAESVGESKARSKELACDWARTETLNCTIVIENRGQPSTRISGSVWAVAEIPPQNPGESAAKFASSDGINTQIPTAVANASRGMRFAARRLTSKTLSIRTPAPAERVTVWILVDGEKQPIRQTQARQGARPGLAQATGPAHAP